jgi:hypothetical protein
MDLFTFLITKVIGGILYAVYWLAWQLFRVVWWLTVLLLLSLGTGVAWLVRGGRAKALDAGGFGHYLEGGALWQDDASGAVYPVSATDYEHCEIHATMAGTYWRRTAISRLVRMGAMLRYRFDTVADPGPDGRLQVVAWREFMQEARKDITLDHADPELAGVDPYGLDQHRELATEAITGMDALLTGRGWQPTGASTDPQNTHWYAIRYSRPVISRDTPVAMGTPAQKQVELPAEQPGGQS